jgi:hypothetical protein
MQKLLSNSTFDNVDYFEDEDDRRLPDSPPVIDAGSIGGERRKRFREHTRQIEKHFTELHRDMISFLQFTNECLEAGPSSTTDSTSQPILYSEIRGGVRILGIEVPLKRREQTVLLGFCRRGSTELGQMEILALWGAWGSKRDCFDKKKIDSVWSTVRSCISKINAALRIHFKLAENQDPISGTGTNRRLDVKLLKNAAQKLRSVSQLV